MTNRMVSFPQQQQEGESGMITGDMWGMIKALHRQGWAQRKIARELDLAPKTVRRALPQATRPLYRRRKTVATLLAGHEAFLRNRALEVDDNARRLFEELRARGYQGGYDLVKLFLRPLRAERDRLVEATLRFETAPGRQAQVDGGSTWAQIGDRRMRVQVFVMVLGYSRRLYAEFTADQTLASSIRCHKHAFEWCGRLTEEILYDNPKTVVLKRDWEGRVLEWHPQFGDFARYDGFTPRLCRPSRAQTKGLGESGIKDRQAQLRQGPAVSGLGGHESSGAGVAGDRRGPAAPWHHVSPASGAVRPGALAQPRGQTPVSTPHARGPRRGARLLGDGGDQPLLGPCGLCRESGPGARGGRGAPADLLAGGAHSEPPAPGGHTSGAHGSRPRPGAVAATADAGG